MGAQPLGLLFDGANVWVVNSQSDSVTKLRASDATRLGTYKVGNRPTGLAFDGQHVRAAVSDSDSVERVESGEPSVPAQPPSD